MNNFEVRTIIKDGLRKNHMTQAALASILGIERATVNRWCVGRAIPEADTFLKVCRILKVRLDLYLYDNDDPIDTQLLAQTARLNTSQKLSLLKVIHQILEMIKDTTMG